MKTRVLAVTLTFLIICLPVQAADSALLWMGGITLDERKSAPNEGTKLEFAVTTGNFLSDITVIVKDVNDRIIVNTVCPGPWLILDLEAGTYQVTALRGNGDSQGASITVSDDNEKFSFMFPDR